MLRWVFESTIKNHYNTNILFQQHTQHTQHRSSPNTFYPKIDCDSTIASREFLPTGFNHPYYAENLSSTMTQAVVTNMALGSSTNAIKSFESTKHILGESTSLFAVAGVPTASFQHSSPINHTSIEKIFEPVNSLCENNRISKYIVALGKTGLDNKSALDIEHQKELLTLHLNLGQKHSLPIYITNTYYEDELVNILSQYPDLTFIIDRPWKSHIMQEFFFSSDNTYLITDIVDPPTGNHMKKVFSKARNDRILVGTGSPWKVDPNRKSNKKNSMNIFDTKYSILPSRYSKTISSLASIFKVPTNIMAKTIYSNSINVFPQIYKTLTEKSQLPTDFDPTEFYNFQQNLIDQHSQNNQKTHFIFDSAAARPSSNRKLSPNSPTFVNYIASGYVVSKQNLHAFLSDIDPTFNQNNTNITYSDTILTRLGLLPNVRSFVGCPSGSTSTEWSSSYLTYLKLLLNTNNPRVAGIGPIGISSHNEKNPQNKSHISGTDPFRIQASLALKFHIPLWIEYSADTFPLMIKKLIVSHQQHKSTLITEQDKDQEQPLKYPSIPIFPKTSPQYNASTPEFVFDTEIYPPIIFSKFPLGIFNDNNNNDINHFLQIIIQHPCCYIAISPSILRYSFQQLQLIKLIPSHKILLMSLSELVWFNPSLNQQVSSSSQNLSKVVYYISKIRNEDPIELMDTIESNSLSVFGQDSIRLKHQILNR